MFLVAAPYVVAGFLLAGAIHQWVQPDLLKKHLGAKGSKPLFKAVGIGAFLPICSCGTIPLGVGLYRCGAAVGTILSFMTSSPVLSPVVVLIAFKMLGLKLTLTLLAFALVGSFLIGALGNLVLKDKRKNGDKGETQQYQANNSNENKAPWVSWLRWSFLDLGTHVSVDLIIGLGLATLAMAFIPVELIGGWMGQNLMLSYLTIIALSIPIYSCSVPSIPIVQSLIMLGLTPGAAVVYLMAGPATNMGELNAISRSMGRKSAIFYVLSLMIIALIAGMITDQFIFSDYEYLAANVNGKLIIEQCCVPILYDQPSIYAIDYSAVSSLEWITGIILLAVLIWGISQKLREFFINPCKSCLWKEYAVENKCAQRCHIHRKYRYFSRFNSLFTPPKATIDR